MFMFAEVPSVSPKKVLSKDIAELISDALRDHAILKIILAVILFLIGGYLIFTNTGEVVTQNVVFSGYDIRGYGVFTEWRYHVCTDPTDRENTSFDVYYHNYGEMRPPLDYEKLDGWYIIKYQKTLWGNKFIILESV